MLYFKHMQHNSEGAHSFKVIGSSLKVLAHEPPSPEVVRTFSHFFQAYLELGGRTLGADGNIVRPTRTH
jgi:hypothetical protein